MEVRKKEKKLIEVTTENYYLCDKCGVRITSNYGDAFEFDFEHKTGNSYSDCGSGESHTLDLCQNCAPKAVELLKSNGFKVQTKEWDY